MKKLLYVILAVAILSVVVNGVLAYKLDENRKDYAKLNEMYYNEATTNVNHEVIENEHGFMVVSDKDNFDDISTVVAVVTDYDLNPDGTISDEYISTTNLYDKDDKIAIDKENYDIGDIVTITFDNDFITDVQKLELATKWFEVYLQVLWQKIVRCAIINYKLKGDDVYANDSTGIDR